MGRAFIIGAGATRSQHPESPLSCNFLSELANYNKALYSHMQDCFYSYNSNIQNANIEDLMYLSDDFPVSLRTNIKESIFMSMANEKSPIVAIENLPVLFNLN